MPSFLSKILATILQIGRSMRPASDRAANHDARRSRNHERIADRLAAMPPMTREVFVLSVVEKMPMAQVAHRLAISREEARTYLRQAIGALLLLENNRKWPFEGRQLQATARG